MVSPGFPEEGCSSQDGKRTVVREGAGGGAPDRGRLGAMSKGNPPASGLRGKALALLPFEEPEVLHAEL